MARNNDLQSQSLDLLRFPLAVAVVFIHIYLPEGFTVQGENYPLSDYPFMQFFSYLMDCTIRHSAVPVFFFVSGFVFFLGADFTRDSYFVKLKKRVRTLLVPYLLWNLLALGVLLAKRFTPLSALYPNLGKAEVEFSIPAFLQCFWNNALGMVKDWNYVAGDKVHPADVPLWYVRDLMIVVLAAPLIYWLIRRFRWWFVGLLGLVWLALHGHYGHWEQLSVAFFFFSWGACFSINRLSLTDCFTRYASASFVGYALLMAAFLCSAYWFPSVSRFIEWATVPAAVVCFFNLAYVLLKRGICRNHPWLASASFFLFVSHLIFCKELLKVLFLCFRPASDGGLFLIHLLSIVLTVAVVLGVYRLLQMFAPRFLAVITGGKG